MDETWVTVGEAASMLNCRADEVWQMALEESWATRSSGGTNGTETRFPRSTVMRKQGEMTTIEGGPRNLIATGWREEMSPGQILAQAMQPIVLQLEGINDGLAKTLREGQTDVLEVLDLHKRGLESIDRSQRETVAGIAETMATIGHTQRRSLQGFEESLSRLTDVQRDTSEGFQDGLERLTDVQEQTTEGLKDGMDRLGKIHRETTKRLSETSHRLRDGLDALSKVQQTTMQGLEEFRVWLDERDSSVAEALDGFRTYIRRIERQRERDEADMRRLCRLFEERRNREVEASDRRKMMDRVILAIMIPVVLCSVAFIFELI